MVRSALDVATIRHADHDRTVPFAVRAVINAGKFIEELVDPCPDVVGKLDLGNGLVAVYQRHTDRKPDDRRFGKRRVEAAVFAMTSLSDVRVTPKTPPLP